VQAELPDELVYKMIKTLFDRRPTCQGPREGQEHRPQDGRQRLLDPAAPGVVKYYKEKGVLK